ncbi:MAG: AMP-binding protein, partial [Pseudomonadota bacterium]
MSRPEEVFHPKNHAKFSPGKVAYIIPEDDVFVTYRELDEKSNQIAHTFRALGLNIDDGIAFLVENRQGFFEICWAAQRAGLHYTPISTHLGVSEITYIVTNCEAKLFIVSARFKEIAEDIRRATPNASRLICLGGDIPGFDSFE